MSRIQHLMHAQGLGPIEHTGPGRPFGDLTVFYAENGRGKSTMAATLRAAGTLDPAPLQEKRRPDSTDSPKIGIKHEGAKKPLLYNNSGWNGEPLNIEVFDAHFTHTHVHAGQQVDRDHRINILQFALGSESVALAEKIRAWTDRIARCHDDFKGAESELTGHACGLPLAEFLDLPERTDVDQEIKDQEHALDLAKKASAIAERAVPSAPPVIQSLPLDRIKKLLSFDADEAVKQANVRARARIEAFGSGGAQWAEDGVSKHLSDEEKCPLCNRRRGPDDGIYDLLEYFSDEYKQLMRDLAAEEDQFKAVYGNPNALTMAVSVAQQKAGAWGNDGIAPLPDLRVQEATSTMSDVCSRVRDLIQKKRESPLDAVQSDSDLSEVARGMELVEAVTAEVKAAIDECMSACQDVQSETASSDAPAIERQIQKLRAAKTRWTNPHVAEACRLRERRSRQKKTFEKRKADLRERLREEGNKTWTEYAVSLNTHLADFDCAFRLADPKTSFKGKEPAAEFGFALDGVPIAIAPGKESHHFGNTFSEGDKASLALAFFLARVKRRADLSDTVIVFDDPFTSLGRHRRSQTVREISRLVDAAQQVVVLSHDAVFARDVANSARHAKDNRFYELRRSGQRSEIHEVDLERLTQSDYFKSAETMMRFLVDGSNDLLGVARSIRPFLEGNLRMRAIERFDPSQWLGDYINAIRAASQGDPLALWSPLLPDLTDLNDFSKDFHHPNAVAPTDGELRVYCRKALDFAEGTPPPQ